MPDFITQPWPWYVAGPIIGLTVPALLLLGNKSLGISSALRHFCAACMPGTKIPFFQYDWRKESWNLLFVTGILLGGAIASHFLASPEPLAVTDATRADLQALGVQDFGGYMPADIFGPANIFSMKGLLFMIVGGFLVGFGTRYAGGCTSGHSIMGLSSLQWPSLVATICFMAGGFLCTWLFFPLIFKLI